MINYEFENNWAWFFLLIPFLMLLFWILKYKYIFDSVKISSINTNTKSFKSILVNFLPLLLIVASFLIVIGIAKPITEDKNNKKYTNGIDIVLAMDISTSMLEQDFKPNRLEVAKKLAKSFVASRQNDRIGLVVFSGESFTQCPPTIDHNILLNQIDNIKNGIIEDGTAIGMGMATSIRALKNSNSKSKVVILLTDGVNTAGLIDPNTAIKIAKNFNTKFYCIGVGTLKNNIMGIDEPLMNNISKSTGGKYFRATSKDQLEKIFDEINRLETVEIEVNSYYRRKEEFLLFVVLAFGFIVAYIIAKYYFLRSILW